MRFINLKTISEICFTSDRIWAIINHQTVGKMAKFEMPHWFLLRAMRTYPFSPQAVPQLKRRKKRLKNVQ